MALGVIYKQPTEENLKAAMIGDKICLLQPRRNGRRHLKLYRDSGGRPYVLTKWSGRCYIRLIAFTTIDGKSLECGSAIIFD